MMSLTELHLNFAVFVCGDSPYRPVQQFVKLLNFQDKYSFILAGRLY
jgi:hypothetical protein